MKVTVVELTEEQIQSLPFPETARAIGGLLVAGEAALENHLNINEFVRQWNEMVSKGGDQFKKPEFVDEEVLKIWRS